MTYISPFILLTSGGYKWTSGHGKWFIYLFHKLDVCLQVSNVFVIQMKKKGTGLSLSMKQASGQDTYSLVPSRLQVQQEQVWLNQGRDPETGQRGQRKDDWSSSVPPVFFYLVVLVFPWGIIPDVRVPYITFTEGEPKPFSIYRQCPALWSNFGESPPSMGKSFKASGQNLGYIYSGISANQLDYRLPVTWFPVVFCLDTCTSSLWYFPHKLPSAQISLLFPLKQY